MGSVPLQLDGTSVRGPSFDTVESDGNTLYIGPWFIKTFSSVLLCIFLFIAAAELIHGQLLRMGDQWFSNLSVGVQYFDLRADLVVPTCDPEPGIGRSAADLEGCQAVHRRYLELQALMSPELEIFRSIEARFLSFSKFGIDNQKFILLIFLAWSAWLASIKKTHFSWGNGLDQKSFEVRACACLLFSLLGVSSSITFLNLNLESGVGSGFPILFAVPIVIFLVLGVSSLHDLFFDESERPLGTSYMSGLGSVPLYVWMGLLAGLMFLVQGFFSGLAIYVQQFTDYSELFIGLVLYVWAGVLFSRSELLARVFDVFRPWRLSVEFQCAVVLMIGGLLTAYTGVSGVFLFVCGTILLRELLQKGAHPSVALATTSMTGALGGVWVPSVLVALVVALNKQVSSSELFSWGAGVWSFTVLVFLALSRFSRPATLIEERAIPEGRFVASTQALWGLFPYVVVSGIVLFAFSGLFGVRFTEDTGPVFVLLVMLFIAAFERVRGKWFDDAQWQADADELDNEPESKRKPHSTQQAVQSDFSVEAVAYCGALFMLVVASLALAGLIDRLGVIQAITSGLETGLGAITVLMLILVALGMLLEPISAIILISSLLAPVAFQLDMHPVHFWLMALVALQFSYVAGPVAVGHILARRAFSQLSLRDFGWVKASKVWSLAGRYDHWVLSACTLGLVLLVVSYAGGAVVNQAAPSNSTLSLNDPLASSDESFATDSPGVGPEPATFSFSGGVTEFSEQASQESLDSVRSALLEGAEQISDETKEQNPALVEVDVESAKQELDELDSILEDWAFAWSNRDVPGYLSFYSKAFELPGEMNREQWELQRRNRIVNKEFIDVQLSDVMIVSLGNDRAQVSFIQVYESNNYTDTSKKEITLQRENAFWRIVSEQSQSVR